MITECYNPVCKKELRYLRDGRVIRVVKVRSTNAKVEHFWLCGDCFQLHDFRLTASGIVRLVAKKMQAETTGWTRHRIFSETEISHEDISAA